jgi:2,3-bisphosphoglycerate-independent phosphoglycerate mutase
MTEYDETFSLPIAFPPDRLNRILGQVVADAGLQQLRIAETEKYPHVTFFFNGGVETPMPGEDRVLIPSPKVATYDLQPEMNAPLVTEAVVDRIRQQKYSMVILNYANADMVGHTGSIPAAIKAVEIVDKGVGEVVAATLAVGGAVLVAADHGNAEKMLDENGKPFTAHTTYPIELIYVAANADRVKVRPGILADIAPTILDLLKVPAPAEMTGRSLLVR